MSDFDFPCSGEVIRPATNGYMIGRYQPHAPVNKMTYPFPRGSPGSISAYDRAATVIDCSYPLIRIENYSTGPRECLGRLYFCLHRGKFEAGRSVLLSLDLGFVSHDAAGCDR